MPLNDLPQLAGVFPPFYAERLRAAALNHDAAGIDAVRDELTRIGLCRPRDDDRYANRGAA